MPPSPTIKEAVPTDNKQLKVTSCRCKGLETQPQAHTPTSDTLAQPIQVGAAMARDALSCQLQNKQSQIILPCLSFLLCSFLASCLADFLSALLLPPLLSACVSEASPGQPAASPPAAPWCPGSPLLRQLVQICSLISARGGNQPSINPPWAAGRQNVLTPPQ